MISDNNPIHLGQYKLGKTLGIGAFGKVKCKMKRRILLEQLYTTIFLSIISGAPYIDWIESSCQDIKQGKDKTHGNGGESSSRDKYLKDVYPSAYL